MKPVSPGAMDALFARSAEQGQPRLSYSSATADFSCGCQKPVYMEFYSKEDAIRWHSLRFPKSKLWRFHGGASHLNKNFHDVKSSAPRKFFDAWLPCRKCEVCLRHRSKLWQARIKSELSASSRNWFATFTLNPHERVLIDIKINSRYYHGDDLFVARHRAICREFTLYFKRLRKNTGSKFRYILVAECHKDGWPHYHAFIHELGTNVTKRQLESEWSHGFTSFKLVSPFDRNVHFYLTKYIAKQALARIRASLRYGQPYVIVREDVVKTDVKPPTPPPPK